KAAQDDSTTAQAAKTPSQPAAIIHENKDNSVTVIVNRLNFVQVIATTLTMLVAEELDADWSKVRGELAPAGDAYKDPRFGSKPTKQISGTAKSSGTQAYGLDIYRPGMKTVLIARPPVFGAKVASFDAAPSKAVAGVVDALQVPLDRGATGIAIVADGYWPAKQ